MYHWSFQVQVDAATLLHFVTVGSRTTRPSAFEQISPQLVFIEQNKLILK